MDRECLRSVEWLFCYIIFLCLFFFLLDFGLSSVRLTSDTPLILNTFFFNIHFFDTYYYFFFEIFVNYFIIFFFGTSITFRLRQWRRTRVRNWDFCWLGLQLQWTRLGLSTFCFILLNLTLSSFHDFNVNILHFSFFSFFFS